MLANTIFIDNTSGCIFKLLERILDIIGLSEALNVSSYRHCKYMFLNLEHSLGEFSNLG